MANELTKARKALDPIFISHGYAPGHTTADVKTKRWEQSLMKASINTMYKNGFVVRCSCSTELPEAERTYARRTRGDILVAAIERAGHKVSVKAYTPTNFDGRIFVVFLKKEE